MATVQELKDAVARFDAVSDKLVAYVAEQKNKPAGMSEDEMQGLVNDLTSHTDALEATMADKPAEAPAPEPAPMPEEVPTDGSV